jgi:2-amino-4-hydroxy-6-hydroxymethyldihydropteridine diphosphokinase
VDNLVNVYLALGANVGNRRRNIQLALRWLAPAVRVTAVSSLYGSKALVLEGAPAGPDYLNCVCEGETELVPHDLLAHVKSIEHAIGRRPAARWSARPIDIDILLYADAIIDTPDLTIPHPRIAERNFVLIPLAELAGDLMHPVAQRTVAGLAADIDPEGLEHLAAPDEWRTVGTT